ncbi:MAG: UDP-N-acetylglucosamine--N-acetylmuramyl-(pentapeptide) pyrophosphoryl-undecaprenol N-acetylglucosamine transferase, partial [Sciscionella sp.]
KPVVAAGGALLVPDAEFTQEKVVELIGSMFTDPARLERMSSVAARTGHREADEVLARMVLDAVRK